MRRIHILRPGTFRAQGADHTFDAADLAATAAAYNPARHEAPIVVGHPDDAAPAYGWVGALTAERDGLYAAPRQVDARFAELVEAGRFKKVSASFYAPGHPNHPGGESWYLRHVGFLGAAPPVVKGLRPVELGEAGEAVVTVELALAEETSWAWSALARLLRGLREHLLEKDGMEAADRVAPGYLIEDVEREADRAEPTPAAFSEPDPNPNPHEDDPMPPAEPAATTDLAEREAQLARDREALDARARALAEGEARRATRDATDFAERLAAEGRILPRDQAALAALLVATPAAGDGPTVSFAESDDADPQDRPAGAFLRHFLGRLPVQVDYAERASAAGDAPPAPAPGLALPKGHVVDKAAAEHHRKILALAEQHECSYDEAITLFTQTQSA